MDFETNTAHTSHINPSWRKVYALGYRVRRNRLVQVGDGRTANYRCDGVLYTDTYDGGRRRTMWIVAPTADAAIDASGFQGAHSVPYHGGSDAPVAREVRPGIYKVWKDFWLDI